MFLIFTLAMQPPHKQVRGQPRRFLKLRVTHEHSIWSVHILDTRGVSFYFDGLSYLSSTKENEIVCLSLWRSLVATKNSVIWENGLSAISSTLTL